MKVLVILSVCLSAVSALVNAFPDAAPPPFPVNYTSTVQMDAYLGGGTHIQTSGIASVSCDPRLPGKHRYRVDVSFSTIEKLKFWVTRCDMGKTFKVSSETGKCCYEDIAPNTPASTTCDACPWDVTKWQDCKWAAPTKIAGSVQYTLPGPCPDFLWPDTNISAQVNVRKSGSPASFRRSTFVENAMVPSSCKIHCKKNSVCCAPRDAPKNSGACYAVKQCSDLTPPALEEVDAFSKDFTAVKSFQPTVFSPKEIQACNSPCTQGN
jgi:hypothetical protein